MAAERSILADQAGFTLIEVLVALAIAGIAFSLAFRAYSGASFLAENDLRQEQAASVLESELARVGQDIPLVNGPVHGETADGYAWQIDIGDAADATKPLFGHEIVKRLIVTVVWTSGGYRHEAHIVTLRLAGWS